MKRLLRSYWPTVAVGFAILYLSISTGESLPKIPLFDNADKVVHFLMYAGLTFTLTWAMRERGKSLISTALWAILIASAFGGLMEIIQPYFPPRTGDILDFIADAAGAGCSFIITDILWQRINCSTK